MNARQRRYARRHSPPLVAKWDPNLGAFRQMPWDGKGPAVSPDLAKFDAIAQKAYDEAREVKRIPKWKRLAMLLGLSSALLGCAAKKPARASFVIPFDCLREVQAADTLCNGTASPDTFDCNHVRVKADCVKAVR